MYIDKKIVWLVVFLAILYLVMDLINLTEFFLKEGLGIGPAVVMKVIFFTPLIIGVLAIFFIIFFNKRNVDKKLGEKPIKNNDKLLKKKRDIGIWLIIAPIPCFVVLGFLYVFVFCDLFGGECGPEIIGLSFIGIIAVVVVMFIGLIKTIHESNKNK